jgi:Family of unknown function (DUF5681)
MPEGPDLCNVRKSETCGVAPFLSVAPLRFTFVIKEYSMSRDNNGRFTDCGNPKGRPKALKYTPPTGIAHCVQRNDFFEVDNAPITISENGKRKLISVRKAIYQKLAYSAASGDTRAAVEWNKMRTRFVSDYVDEQMAMMAQIRRSEKTAQDFPEDVTDKFLECLRSLKMMLGPGYQI